MSFLCHFRALWRANGRLRNILDLTEAPSYAKRGELDRAEQDISQLAGVGMLNASSGKYELSLGLLVNEGKVIKN